MKDESPLMKMLRLEGARLEQLRRVESAFFTGIDYAKPLTVANRAMDALEGIERLEATPSGNTKLEAAIQQFKEVLLRARPYWGRGLHIPDDYLRGPG